jgi:nicotinamidase-related amidase
MSAPKILRAEEKSCGLLIIDLQEKFASRIHNWEGILASTLRIIHFFRLIQAPIAITEQYPKGLGATVAEVKEALAEGSSYVSKTSFSSCGTEDLRKMVKTFGRRQWILCGIEAHVCVQQSVFDLLEMGFDVFLPVDAISSQRPTDREMALQRMFQAGAVLSTSESLIFEILRDAQHPLFKQASQIVKNL